ncbi:MAG TPA: ABC transporter permease [Xylella sp.]
MNTLILPKLKTFVWLLKREYWEHRGGFFWAPVITGAIAVFFAILGAVIGIVNSRPNGNIINVESYQQVLGTTGDILILMSIGLTSMVLTCSMLFYALGSLHNDRDNRTILFWKSLPISDTQTVLSKAVWALLPGPLISVTIGMMTGLALLLVATGGLLAIRDPYPWAMITRSHPFQIFSLRLKIVPIQLLWSLPTIGWLMFCSTWARTKPFLWALLLPILSSMMISILAAMPGIYLPLPNIWYILVYRGLFSIVPVSWWRLKLDQIHLYTNDVSQITENSFNALMQHIYNVNVYPSSDLWIGACVGITLIIASIYLRHHSNEI